MTIERLVVLSRGGLGLLAVCGWACVAFDKGEEPAAHEAISKDGPVVETDDYRAAGYLSSSDAELPNQPTCSGTWICRNIFLTAAHCVDQGTSFHVGVGKTSSVKFYSVPRKRAFVNPQWNRDRRENDVAVLVLPPGHCADVSPKKPTTGQTWMQILHEYDIVGYGFAQNGQAGHRQLGHARVLEAPLTGSQVRLEVISPTRAIRPGDSGAGLFDGNGNLEGLISTAAEAGWEFTATRLDRGSNKKFINEMVRKYCIDSCSPSMGASGGGNLDYMTSGTNSARTNASVSGVIALVGGETLKASTCPPPSESQEDPFIGSSDDTFLRLFCDGREVSASDDSCSTTGFPLASTIAYTPAARTSCEVRAGCFGNTPCRAKLRWTTSVAPADSEEIGLPSCANDECDFCWNTTPFAMACDAEWSGTGDGCDCGCQFQDADCMQSQPPATDGSFSYGPVSGTNGAAQGYATAIVPVDDGETVRLSTCPAHGGSANGDTFLRLFCGGAEVAWNDDTCPDGPVVASTLSYTPAASGNCELHMGCFSDRQCSGVVAVERSQEVPTPPPPATPDCPAGAFCFEESATAGASVDYSVAPIHIAAGETMQLSTCPQGGGDATGDTLLRLYCNGALVAMNDDACPTGPNTLASTLSYRATAESNCELRMGCFADGACRGTVAMRRF